MQQTHRKFVNWSSRPTGDVITARIRNIQSGIIAFEFRARQSAGSEKRRLQVVETDSTIAERSFQLLVVLLVLATIDAEILQLVLIHPAKRDFLHSEAFGEMAGELSSCNANSNTVRSE